MPNEKKQGFVLHQKPNAMPPRYTLLYVLLLPLLFLAACNQVDPGFYDGPGKRPVYAAPSALENIRNLPPQTIEQSGTIFLKDTLFFMLERGRGIHVFNIKDSASIRALTFLEIPAIGDFTISGNRLYADSWRDLLTIDISNLYNIQLLDRQRGVFSPALFPPQYDGFFECVDESKGAVVRWEDAELIDALCRTF